MTGAFIAVCVAGGVALLVAPFLRREWTVLRHALIAFSLAANARYMYWRVTQTLPAWDFSWISAAAYAFLGLEIVAMFLSIQLLLLLRRTRNRTQDADAQLDWYGGAAPRVDVFIATYNESWDVLEKTVVGALSQNYPNYRVWLLDDGNRRWLAKQAEALDIGYVTRLDNAHYKAGNLNNGIAELRARGIALEFIALLDADFVARPEFLRRTMALMKDASVGIVQTPQCFYNPDPHQQVFGGVKNWPDEQRSWFDVFLPALDALGWATCCGTSCAVRIAALDAIGGFPTESVCEDTLSSMKMSRAGFKTVYLHESLTVGLAPEGLGEFLSQRARWLVGGVQNTRAMGARPGLKGRVLYWLALWRMAIFGLMQTAWIALCVFYWFTGIYLIRASSFDDAISHFSPQWLDRFFQGWLNAGTRMLLVADAIWMLAVPLWIKETTRAVVGSTERFKVTDKAVRKDRTVVHWHLIRFQLGLLALLLGGFAYNMISPAAPAYNAGFFQSNTLITFIFVAFILAGVAPAIESPKRRKADRYETNEALQAIVDGRTASWRCVDLSMEGALVEAKDVQFPANLKILLEGMKAPIACRLVRLAGADRAAYAFESPSLRSELIRRIYCTDSYIPRVKRWSLTRALTVAVSRALR